MPAPPRRLTFLALGSSKQDVLRGFKGQIAWNPTLAVLKVPPDDLAPS